MEGLEERVLLTAITVTGTGDAVVFDGFVTLRGAIGGTVVGAGNTIANNNSAGPSVTLNVSSATFAEAGGTSMVTATLSAVSSLDVTIDLAFTGTATNVSDYTRTGAQIVILAGSTNGTVTLTAVQDTLDETNETIIVDISSVTNGTESGVQQGTATITDDDATPTLSISDVTVLEGSSGTTNAVFTVTLSAASGQTVTVVAKSANGTARIPSDYFFLRPTTLTFAPGVTSQTVTVQVKADTLVEPNETFFVNLTLPLNATIADTQGVGTILNDDSAPPTLSISDVTVLEGSSGTTNAVFTVTLSAASGQTVTVVAKSANGTARIPSDYFFLRPTTLTFAPGVTSQTVTVQVKADTLVEPNETFFVNLTLPLNATIADTQGVGTILNDDSAAPSVSISNVSGSIAEADGTYTVTATLSATSGQAVTVNLGFSGTATDGVDYTHVGTQIVIPAGSLSGTLTLTAVSDTLDETDETIIVDILSVTNGTESGTQQVTITILDDDPTPTLSISDVTVSEGNSGTTNAVFTVTLSAASGQTVTVVANSFNNTASSSSDYIAISPTTLTFLPGQTGKTVTVQVNGDTQVEPNETFFVNLTSAVNATIADNQGVGTITNDDSAAPSVSISNASGSIAEAGGTYTVTATLSAVSSLDVTVNLAFGGTATDVVDYTHVGTQIVIPAGSLSGTLTLTAVSDTLDETDETIIVDILSVTNGTESGTQQVTITILDDDPTPTLSISNVTVREGNSGSTNAVFTVRLSAASAQTVTVVANSADGTASSPSDYIAISPTTLTFLPGQTGKTVTVQVNGDTQVEPNETFFVNLTSAVNATIADTQGVGTILNDDSAPPTLSISDVTVREGNSGTTNAVFTVTLSAASTQTVTVVANSADGTASSPSDYIAISPTTLTFLPGQTFKTVTVAVKGDTLVELNETFFVNLTSAVNATFADAQGLGTILNDDPAA